jgi:autotransporter-associated beta strand protein
LKQSVFRWLPCCTASLVLAWSPAALGQTFTSQGPAPQFQEQAVSPRWGPIPITDVASGMFAAGAIQTVVPDPVDPRTLYVGATNGGIWATHNGGASWTPLTDRQASLSIGSLSLDPTDSSRKTLVAGIGYSSNGYIGNFDQGVAGLGGALTGLLYSTDGGASWSALGTTDLSGKNVVDAAARGSIFLAAVNDRRTSVLAGGLYRSTDGGTGFQLVGSAAGLGTGPVTALTADPVNPNVFYAAVRSSSASDAGIYISSDDGATWTKRLATDTSQAAKLSAGPGGSVVAAVWNLSAGQLVSLKLSRDGGLTWTALTTPNVNEGGQAKTNLAVAIDPANPNIVYVAGDGAFKTNALGVPYDTGIAFRVTLKADGTSTSESLTDDFTANGSTFHADARLLTFDPSGRLLVTSDGGLFVRSQPQSSAGVWSTLNTSTLSTYEPYRVAYDAVSKRLVVAAQDNGTAYQTRSGDPLYTMVNDGDGTNAAINDRTLPGRSVIYSSAQGLGDFSRVTIDAQGRQVAVKSFAVPEGFPTLNFEPDDDPTAFAFFVPLVLNRVDPTRIAIGTRYVYVTQDVGASSDTLPLTNIGVSGSKINQVTALAYGTNDNPNALLAGVQGDTTTSPGKLYLSTTSTPGSLQPLVSYAGGWPTGVVFDPRAYARFYVVDGASAWATANTGTSFSDLTPNLTALTISRPMSVEFISNNGVNALLVGGLVSVATAQSPIAVADSDAGGTLSNWRAFGFGLPNTIVGQLSYNPAVDVLAVGLFGRGAWLLYDVTSYFPSATVLRFGLADNDSMPDASILTGNRPLEKMGTGTLTLTGTASYTGSTTVNAGTLRVAGSIASSTALTVGSAGTLSGNGIVPTTVMNGTLAPGNPGGALTVAGTYTQNAGASYRAIVTPGGLGDRLNVTGSATLAGTVIAAAASGNYGRGVTYTILSAAGGLTGTYAGVSGGLPFLQPALSYDANDVFLTLAPGGFAAAGQTPNQVAVGGAIDRGIATASGDFLTVVNALSEMSLAQAPAVLEQLGGQNYAGFSTLQVQSALLFMNTFSQQAGGGQRQGTGTGTGTGTGGRIALAEACDVACDAAPTRWSAWGGPLGGVGTIAGNANAHGQTFTIGGFAAGIDRRFEPGFLAGVAVGYAAANQYTQGMDGLGTSNTVQAGLYGSTSFGNAYLDALAGWAHSDNQMTRPIAVPGLVSRTAIGRTTTEQVFGQLEGGYRVELGGPASAPLSAFVTPFARLQGATARQAGFSESGADSLSLTVAAQTTNALRTVLGAQLGGSIDLGWRDRLGLVLRAGWSHDYADTARPVNASFAGAPASPFSVAGAEAPRDGAVFGVAANSALAAGTGVYFRYDAELAGGNTAHVFSAGLRVFW